VSIEEHGNIEDTVTDVSSDIEGDVVKAEANDAPSSPILVQLWIIGGTPHCHITPAEKDAEVTKENLVDNRDLDAQ